LISVIIPAYNEDGGSNDRTRQIALSHPGVRIVDAAKGRASQMNAGAAGAGGTWLLFLHADTLLPEGALSRISAMTPDERCQAGGFRHRFSGDDWRLRLISYLDNRRCERTKIIYGDQAMFIRRHLFERLGGFPSQAILEDVRFCEKLVKVTDPKIFSDPVVTDSRKFVQKGIWLSLGRVAFIQTRIELGLPVSADHPFFQDVR
jgi:rSAM/selenodomain-associated transferase 2